MGSSQSHDSSPSQPEENVVVHITQPVSETTVTEDEPEYSLDEWLWPII